ncbi:MAG: hypothetical protein WC782_00135 [Methylococcaceae bacterium]
MIITQRHDSDSQAITVTELTYASTGGNSDHTGSYTYPNHSNQLLSAQGQTVSYDLSGNMTGDGNLTYTYNQAGQLAQASQNGVVIAVIARYAYDYQGRRTQKTVNGGTTLFFYDQDGHLLAEASTNGTYKNPISGKRTPRSPSSTARAAKTSPTISRPPP